MDNEKDLEILHEKIRLSEERFHVLLEHGTEGIIIISPSGLPVYVSPIVEEIFGYTREELFTVDLSSLGHPDELEQSSKIRTQIMDNPGIPFSGLVSRRRHKKGHWIWVEATITNMLDNPTINGIVNNFRDITARVEAKEQLIYSNRLYNFLSHINQTIVHVSDEQVLFEEVCRIAVEHGKFEFAWISIADTVNKTLIMQAAAGATETDISFFKNYNYQIDGPMDQVLSGIPYYVVSEIQERANSMFISYANERGFKSAIFLAIKKSGRTIGTFNLYSSAKDFFNDQEIALLQEACVDISFALDVFSKDLARDQAEKELLRSEAKLENAQSIAKIGSWEIDLPTFEISWSKQTYRIFETDPDTYTPTYDGFLGFIPQKQQTKVEAAFRNPDQSSSINSISYKITDSEQRDKYIELQWKITSGPDGFPKTAIGTCQDVTQQKEAEQKLIYANRLYGFISHINQAIAHEKEAQSLFTQACRIAIEHGGFKFAWIGLTQPQTRKIDFSASWDATPDDTNFFKDYTYDAGGPIERVLNGEEYFVITDIQQQLNDKFNSYARLRGYKSAICLSIKKAGVVVGTFNMYSSEKHFFTPTEIALLKEVTQDISFALDVFENERKRTEAEQALQHKERRLRQAQTIAHLGNWELDFRTGRSIWSEEVLRIFGLPAGETIQSFDSWFSFIHPDDRESVLEAVRHREATNESTNFQYRIIRRDGTIRHIYNYSNYEFNSAGEPTLVTGVTHDITELKTAEANVLKIAAEKNIILESIGDAFFAVDNNWVVTYWNKTAEELLHTPKDRILGQSLWDVFDKNAGPKSYENYHKAMESGEVIRFQEYYPPLERWFEISAYPAMNALSVYFKDISERINGEISRLKMVDDIVQRNKDLEQFSFMVSHNLRAPVANIIGLAAELNEDQHPQEIKKILKKELALSSKRLDEVILDINNILHLKRERKEHTDLVDFNELVDSIRLTIADIIESNNAVIETDFTATGCMLTIKSYIYSIFYNLISNSIKYRQLDLPPRIKITSSKTSDSTIIEFRDNGLGINIERQKDQIFGIYRRFHQHVEGKGLGLFMVKTQVEILGGIISIESKVDQGTCFTIEFFNQ